MEIQRYNEHGTCSAQYGHQTCILGIWNTLTSSCQTAVLEVQGYESRWQHEKRPQRVLLVRWHTLQSHKEDMDLVAPTLAHGDSDSGQEYKPRQWCHRGQAARSLGTGCRDSEK